MRPRGFDSPVDEVVIPTDKIQSSSGSVSKVNFVNLQVVVEKEDKPNLPNPRKAQRLSDSVRPWMNLCVGSEEFKSLAGIEWLNLSELKIEGVSGLNLARLNTPLANNL